MANVIQQPHHFLDIRTGAQRVCVGLGIVFITIGLTGVLHSDLLGMHLSVIHNFIHLVSGSLCIWSGISDDLRKSYLLSCILGSAYALLGIFGFILGTPGFPSVGDVSSDNYLWRVLPGILEFAVRDHTFHLFVGLFFLLGAFFWKMKVDSFSRTVVDIQRRK